jgi:Ion channel
MKVAGTVERSTSNGSHGAARGDVVCRCTSSGPWNIRLSGFRACFCNRSRGRRFRHVGEQDSGCCDAHLTWLGQCGAISRLKAPSILDVNLFASAWLIMGITLACVVAPAVFASGRVTYHHFMGAVLLYLTIAVTFVALFTFVGSLVPKAFSGLSIEDSPALASNLIYFSFVTLTTTGYGDIFPVHPVARSLCNLESIFGQLYPATLLARLVTLELAGRA